MFLRDIEDEHWPKKVISSEAREHRKLLLKRVLYRTHLVFYKYPVYKQLALGWQIAKQFSGLNPFH